MKKRLLINFVDFANDFDKKNNDFVRILTENYEVVFSDKPDYLFYSNFGYKHTKYDCVKIFFTGENVVPNFSLCDYAIGFSELSFGDRYLRWPLYKVFQYRKDLECALLKNNPNKLVHKDSFCAFVVSNDNGMKERKDFFLKLCEYKKVSSGGRYLNNTGQPVKDKISFQAKHKFVIAFENSSTPGYTTEKIVQAFESGSIPIYYGNPNIENEFNGSAFINCHRYKDFDEVIERIKQIDNDDALFFKMLNSPITSNDLLDEKELRLFLNHIFEQEYQHSFRTVKNSQTIEETKKEKLFAKHYKTTLFKKRVRGFFRRMKRKSM